MVFKGARLRVAPLLNGGRNKISLVYASDAASAALCALLDESIGPRTYTPEDGELHSWRDLLGAVETAVGHNIFALPVPSAGYRVASYASATFGRVTRRAVMFNPEKVTEMEQEEWVCSAADLTAELGWTAKVKLPEGATLTYDWYRSHGWA
jgi:nucleoside-diphosphate-sugar epimerase